MTSARTAASLPNFLRMCARNEVPCRCVTAMTTRITSQGEAIWPTRDGECSEPAVLGWSIGRPTGRARLGRGACRPGHTAGCWMDRSRSQGTSQRRVPDADSRRWYPGLGRDARPTGPGDRAVLATSMPGGTFAVTGFLGSLGAGPGGDAFLLQDRFTSEWPPPFLKAHPTRSHVLVAVRADGVTSQLRSSNVVVRSHAAKVEVRKLEANLRVAPWD
ncbi:MAG: hypothetical protein KatS3mg082_2971 [Nitrospiraceae bacterium]|nr:MAG: hypothetical protein KatS3mg082_2971 [Nitrospiraceae bacterium]